MSYTSYVSFCVILLPFFFLQKLPTLYFWLGKKSKKKIALLLRIRHKLHKEELQNAALSTGFEIQHIFTTRR